MDSKKIAEEKIRAENKGLRHLLEGYMEDIQRLKEVNEQHEKEIETLLKFNERLLTIIQSELNQYSSKRSERSYSLHPISQITEKDSEIADEVASIKASLVSNFRLDFPDLQDRNTEHRSGRETDRVRLGHNMDQAVSYSASRSDYQREFSEYSQSDKVKSVMALINSYRREYGNSIRQYDEMRTKLRTDLQSDNKEIKTLNSESSNFFGAKEAQLSSLKQRIKSNGPQHELQKMLKSNQFSVGTQNILMKLMNSIK